MLNTQAQLGKRFFAMVDTALNGNVAKTKAAWDPLLHNIELFENTVDGILEIHPLTIMALSVLSSAQKRIIAQKDGVDTINRLAKSIGDTYAFVRLAEPLKKIESKKSIVISLTIQTIECAYFIRDYVKNKDLWEKTVKNLESSVDNKVERYQATLHKLRLTILDHAYVQTEIPFLRFPKVWDFSWEIQPNDMPYEGGLLQNLVSDVGQVQDKFNQQQCALQEDAATHTGSNALRDLRTLVLHYMPYAAGAHVDPLKGCLPGTREKVIAQICEWVNQDSDDTPRIFFLNDVAGAGKSAIAHEIARRFDRLKRLGSSYCFDDANPARSPLNKAFSTIAFDLAGKDPEREALLFRVVRKQRAIRTTHAPPEQFQKFILDTAPAHGLTDVGPTVIVIDGLDKIGNQESRKAFLSVLGDEAGKLPSNFRIFVTGRPEEDILKALVGKEHVLSKRIEDIDPTPVYDDICLIVEAQLGDIAAALDKKWPNKAWCGLLAEKSKGRIGLAVKACRFIKGNGKHGLNPVEQMDILLRPDSNFLYCDSH